MSYAETDTGFATMPLLGMVVEGIPVYVLVHLRLNPMFCYYPRVCFPPSQGVVKCILLRASATGSKRISIVLL